MSTQKKSTTKTDSKVKKQTTNESSKKSIDGKSIGQNVILVIDGKKFSKAFKEKKDRDTILSMVETYNKRNTIKQEKAIIEMMQKGKTTESQRKKAVKNIIPEKIKKPEATTKVLKEDKIAAAKALLEKDGWIISKQAPKSEPSPRQRIGREY